MPALNFQERFAKLVESGKKRQTIRAYRKDGRDPKHTFRAHAAVVPGTKLRFLQYVNKETRPYWEAMQDYGAVLL